MAVIETECSNGVMVVRMNRPERLNALGRELREGMAAAWQEFQERSDAEVAIYNAKQDLEYLIRFQNTGTDTAFKVVVVDVLPPELELATLMEEMRDMDRKFEVRSTKFEVRFVESFFRSRVA